jgi:hypothetical protein
MRHAARYVSLTAAVSEATKMTGEQVQAALFKPRLFISLFIYG